jgi:hypothetical protein
MQANHSSSRGVVLAHVPDPSDPPSVHERITLLEFARRLAALRGCEMGGMYEPSRHYAGPIYFVPSSTLTLDAARTLGIRTADDLFGGVVPHHFVGTKAISHPLVHPGVAAPAGWNPAFAQQVGDAVLGGYVAFDLRDAREAGLRVLAKGAARIKPVRSRGGHGQSVVRDAGELQAKLDALDAAELQAHGVVIEEALEELRTFSVGQIKVGDLLASYYGCQRLTRNNAGREVFGGSDLTVARGGFDELLSFEPEPHVLRAVEHARRYDAAVYQCYPGFFASRRNYDVLLGRDGRCGVLEQSWRVGGATGPELAALEVFRSHPQRSRVRASCFEVFGEAPEPPAHASVYFRGTDPRSGRLTKYTVVDPDDDAR